jgi:membrane protein YqaA with SNARE-associated domain
LILQSVSSAHTASARASGWKKFLAILLSWGLPGLLILAILDSAGLPVVGGVDLLLVDVAANNPRHAYLAAVCALFGSLIGSSILFAIARKGGEVMLAKHIASGRGARLHQWFERYGLITVFVPALSPLPMPMKIPVFCAGALEVRWSYFLAAVSSARAIRYFALAFFAARYGAQTLLFLRTHILLVAIFALSLAALAVIVLQVIDRNRRRRKRDLNREVRFRDSH